MGNKEGNKGMEREVKKRKTRKIKEERIWIEKKDRKKKRWK